MNLLLETLERHARDRPDAPAIGEEDGSWLRWADLALDVARVRAGIAARSRPGANVALALPSGRDFWAACLAAAGSGRMPVLLPCPLPGLVAARLAAELGADHLLIDAETLRALRATSGPATPLEDSLGVTLLSSGTTGHSRFVVRTAETVHRIARILVGEELCVEGDLVVSFLPMSHAYGFEHAFLAPVLAGSAVRALRTFSVDRAASAFAEGATVLPTIPAAAAAIAEARPPAPRLRVTVSAGSPLLSAVRASYERALGPVVDLYGASEIGPIWLDRGEGGRPVEGIDVRIEPAAGVSAGGPRAAGAGEILIGGSRLPRGALDARGALVPITEAGWFRTGDLGRGLPNGAFRIEGRTKLVFDVGGLKVNPIEIEALLERLPSIRRALIHPIPVGPSLSRVGLKIELRPGASPPNMTEVREHLAPHVPPHAIPRSLTVVDDLPKTPSGKLLREPSSAAPAPDATGAAAIPPVVRRPKGLEERTHREHYTKQLFDETARGYDNSSGAAFLRSGRWYRRRMLKTAGVRPGSHHLDVGSGTGLCAAIAQEMVGPTGRVVALDPSTGMLEVAKRRGVRETIEGRAEKLPFPDASFDSVSMSYMLRHIEDLMLAFREARRVLRPGGKIVIFEVTRPKSAVLRESFDLAMFWVVPAVGVVASGKPSTFPMMQYWAETVRDAARPERIVEALEKSGFTGTRHLLEVGVFSCYRGVAPLSPR